MWNMGIMNSYTMEATFCGSSLGLLGVGRSRGSDGNRVRCISRGRGSARGGG